MAKGANVALTREVPGLKGVVVGVDWDAGAERFLHDSLTLLTVLCGSDRKALSQHHVVHFNQMVSADLSTGQVEQAMGGDDEQVEVDLARPLDALRRGLDVGVPNLILRSDRSVREASDPELIQRGDAVLDVAQIARWAGCVGNRTTVVPIADAKHDVFLSVPEARRTAYRELDRWLDWHSEEGETHG